MRRQLVVSGDEGRGGGLDRLQGGSDTLLQPVAGGRGLGQVVHSPAQAVQERGIHGVAAGGQALQYVAVVRDRALGIHQFPVYGSERGPLRQEQPAEMVVMQNGQVADDLLNGGVQGGCRGFAGAHDGRQSQSAGMAARRAERR